MTNALHSTVYSRKQWEFAYICHDRLLVAAFVAVLDNCDSGICTVLYIFMS